MIATTLGLILLGGLVKIVAMVNTSFSDTRVLIDLQNRCRSTQMLLQNDFSHISVTPLPPRPTQADDGYLSLGTTDSKVLSFSNSNKISRGDVNLVDPDLVNAGEHDYVAFTVFNRENPFTFTDPNDSSRTLQTPYAEVVWFIYKNDLYRVTVPFVSAPETTQNYGTGISDVRMISPALLGIPGKRIMNSIQNQITSNKLQQFMVLPNVIHFCVQVYNPKEKKYNEIAEMGDYFKGNNNKIQSKTIGSCFTAYYDTGSVLSETTTSSSSKRDELYVNPDIYQRTDLVPSTAFLPGFRVIIRAFDPDSGTIRQFRAGQDFRTR